MNDFLKGGIVGFLGGLLVNRKPTATQADVVKAQDDLANSAIKLQNSTERLIETFKDEPGDTPEERVKNGTDKLCKKLEMGIKFGSFDHLKGMPGPNGRPWR